MLNLTLKQKISQMFITGFKGKKYNREFYQLLISGLGGVIFFSENIESEKQFKNLISDISKEALIPLFFSIDQEGGRVERTENIHGKKKYLSPKYAYDMGLSYLQNQTKEISLELKNYGINMNFAPVLDVNTNADNPIIGERAFSNKVSDVITAEKIVLKEYEKYGIISVVKHFPGHGNTSSDSHKILPVIDLPLKELNDIHIKPFEEAIKLGVPAIMIAHVIYPSLDTILPASVSYNIINNLLIQKLNFNGVIMTDDMEMNAIKTLSPLEACIKAINAGINMFIFRETSKDILHLIDDIVEAVNNNIITEDKINTSVEKIYNLKSSYGIIQPASL